MSYKMIYKSKKLMVMMVSWLILLTLTIPLVTPSIKAANIYDQAAKGLKETGEAAEMPVASPEPKVNLNTGLINIVNTLLTFVGIFFIILVIYGGYLWMTARGNEQQLEKAKKVLYPAAIGMGIILSARIISEFMIKAVISQSLG